MKYIERNLILFILLSSVTACSPQPTKEVPQEFKKGQEYFHRVCSNCHGSDAMGATTKAPRLIDTDYIERHTPMMRSAKRFSTGRAKCLRKRIT